MGVVVGCSWVRLCMCSSVCGSVLFLCGCVWLCVVVSSCVRLCVFLCFFFFVVYYMLLSVVMCG